MNYKVGDKVMVRKDLEFDEIRKNVFYVDSMKPYLNKEMKIEIIYQGGIFAEGYFWSSEMLEPIKPKKPKYWIEIDSFCSYEWYWKIKCCNGTERKIRTIYPIRSLCLNDARAFAKEVGLEIRL